LLLSGQSGWIPVLVPLVGSVIAVLTTSRATIGLAAFGYATVFVVSAVRRWTSRKALILMAGTMAVVILTPIALSSFERRFATVPQVELYADDERTALKEAASMVLSDHPLGVGSNQYVIVVNTQGYNEKAGVAPTVGSSGAFVHNVYWLVAAESGYLGV